MKELLKSGSFHELTNAEKERNLKYMNMLEKASHILPGWQEEYDNLKTIKVTHVGNKAEKQQLRIDIEGIMIFIAKKIIATHKKNKKTQVTGKLKRDKVISIVKGKQLVGVYWANTDGSEILFETNPEKADKIIAIFNKL